MTTALRVTPVSSQDFGIRPTLERNRLIVKLTGTGDMLAVDSLRVCLGEVHNEMRRLGLEAVEIDIRALYLLNSSCLNALVRYIYAIQTEGPSYPIEFVTEPHLSWQNRALAAFVRMAPRLVSIREG